MKSKKDAIALAQAMVGIGTSVGKKVVALITDMNQPLGRMAGHGNEIIECLDVLSGGGPADLRELSIELAAWMFFCGEKTASLAAGRRLAAEMISSGKAKAKFRQVIELQGGDPRVVEDPLRLPRARSQVRLPSPGAGFITACNCENLGIALAILGGGREKKEDRIDHAVGLEFHSRIGDRVKKGQPLVTIHYNSDAKLADAQTLIAESYTISGGPPKVRNPLIYRTIFKDKDPDAPSVRRRRSR
jgi:pyrimidine-nucleoside phosphorylase